MSAPPKRDLFLLIARSQAKLHRDVERCEAKLDFLTTALVDHPASQGATGLIGTAEAATILGRSRDWVRRHAGKLGVVKLTGGPKPRCMFVRSKIEEIATGAANASPPPSPPRAAAPRKRQPAKDRPELLPVKGRRG